jgi:hypothetical protein
VFVGCMAVCVCVCLCACGECLCVRVFAHVCGAGAVQLHPSTIAGMAIAIQNVFCVQNVFSLSNVSMLNRRICSFDRMCRVQV